MSNNPIDLIPEQIEPDTLSLQLVSTNLAPPTLAFAFQKSSNSKDVINSKTTQNHQNTLPEITTQKIPLTRSFSHDSILDTNVIKSFDHPVIRRSNSGSVKVKENPKKNKIMKQTEEKKLTQTQNQNEQRDTRRRSENEEKRYRDRVRRNHRKPTRKKYLSNTDQVSRTGKKKTPRKPDEFTEYIEVEMQLRRLHKVLSTPKDKNRPATESKHKHRDSGASRHMKVGDETRRRTRSCEKRTIEFRGKTVVLTGEFSKKKSMVRLILEELGATVGSEVDSKVDYVIVSDLALSTEKVLLARKLGVGILSEKDIKRFYD